MGTIGFKINRVYLNKLWSILKNFITLKIWAHYDFDDTTYALFLRISFGEENSKVELSGKNANSYF